MSAPQRSIDGPTWAGPPPGEPPRRRARWVVPLLLLVAVVAGCVAWALLRGDPAGTEPAPRADTPVDEGFAVPEQEPEPVDPELAELRASDRYVAFAEHERAAAAVAAGDVMFGWNHFAVVHDREVTHEWSNKAELWDAVVPPLRDELLLLGEPYTEPMWDEGRPSHASIRADWPDEATGGRGQYIEVTGRYYDEARGSPVELNWAVLIATRDDGSGAVVARMAPVEIVPSQATNFRHARELVSIAAWEWVQAQPILKEGEA